MKILTDQAYGNKTLKRMQCRYIQLLKEASRKKIWLIRGIPTPKKAGTLSTLLPLSSPLLKRTAAKLS
jgi:hypothetical protein